MGQSKKLSLWQKLKRFLTTSAPQPIADDVKVSPHPSAIVDELDYEMHQTQTQQHADTSSNDKHLPDFQASHSDYHADSAFGAKNDSLNSRMDSSSLNKTQQQQRNDTSIVNCLKQYFDDKQWNYTHYQPRTNDSQQSHHLSLRMRHKQLNCGYLFRVQEDNKLLAVYGILPFLMPESHQNAAMLLITQINYDMLIGNLEMDVNDGEIRYKHAIDVEAVGINDAIIEHLLQSVIAMTTVANELFSDLINNQDPAEDMQTLLAELRQQSDSRTFFLPTQYVQ